MESNPATPSFAQGDELFTRALKCDARAVTRGDILANDEAGQTVYPRYANRARGPYLWDADGNRYIDYLLGYGPVILGHSDARVNEAVFAELGKGTCFTPLWSPRQLELTELLTSIIPGADLVHLMKTGSEANSAAVRLARIFTGRDTVIRWGYNGWHDWAVERPAGVPLATRDHTLLFDGTPEHLESLIRQHPNEIAAVLMMPFEYETVDPLSLQSIRNITQKAGILLIFDEMRSGFRVSLAGAQGLLGVQADLVTFSKAIANGFPISALTGRRDILSGLAETKVSSSFYANPGDMAAALATVSILAETDAIEKLWQIGAALQDGLRASILEYGIPAKVVGYPPMPFMRFEMLSASDRRAAQQLFYAETARRGILLHPEHQWFVSASHTFADVETTLEACNHAFRTVARAIG